MNPRRWRPGSRRRRSPHAAAALVALCVGVAALGGALVVGAAAGTEHRSTTAARADALPARVAPAGTGDGATARQQALSVLLARRAAAVLHRDRRAFLATVDPHQTGFRRVQDRLFTALSAVPIATWRYRLDAPATGRTVPRPQRYRGAAEVYAPRSVVIQYQLAGFDATPAMTVVAPTFVRRGARWLLASDADFDAVGAGTQREIWDYGPVASRLGRRSLVLGAAALRGRFAELSDRADAAVPAVSAVVGVRWPRRVVLLVPADATELSGLAGRPRAAVTAMAAMAIGQLVPRARGAHPSRGTEGTVAVGNRILVNPTTLGLPRLAQQVVLTHEVAHVATRPVTAPGAPPWLVEGFADYVAYRNLSLPATTIAAGLRRHVLAGKLPAHLPRAAAFRAGGSALEESYEQSWLAVRMIAAEVGRKGLLRFYRAAAGSAQPAALATAARRELGRSLPELEAAWRTYLRRALA